MAIFDIGRDIDGLKYSLGTQSELEQTAREIEGMGRRVIY